MLGDSTKASAAFFWVGSVENVFALAYRVLVEVKTEIRGDAQDLGQKCSPRFVQSWAFKDKVWKIFRSRSAQWTSGVDLILVESGPVCL